MYSSPVLNGSAGAFLKAFEAVEREREEYFAELVALKCGPLFCCRISKIDV